MPALVLAPITPTEGFAPLKVTFVLKGTNLDRQPASVTVNVTHEGTTDTAFFGHKYEGSRSYDWEVDITHHAAGKRDVDIVWRWQNGSVVREHFVVMVHRPGAYLVSEGNVTSACAFCDATMDAGPTNSVDFLCRRTSGMCAQLVLAEPGFERDFTLTSTGGSPQLEFHALCDHGDPVHAFTGPGPKSGTTPSDGWCAWVWEDGSLPSTITLNITKLPAV